MCRRSEFLLELNASDREVLVMKRRQMQMTAALAGAMLLLAGCGTKTEESSTALGYADAEDLDIIRDDSSDGQPFSVADAAAVQHTADLNTLTVSLEQTEFTAGTTEIGVLLRNDGDREIFWNGGDFRLEYSDEHTAGCASLLEDDTPIFSIPPQGSTSYTIDTTGWGIGSLKAGEYAVLFGDKRLTFTVN